MAQRLAGGSFPLGTFAVNMLGCLLFGTVWGFLENRILPGSDDPAKYKNSSETAIYTKSKTLYGLNWAKADVAKSDQVVVCEGYTDVIGFHQAGVPRAVATCGTALTEDHLNLLWRMNEQPILCFDGDEAGQRAAHPTTWPQDSTTKRHEETCLASHSCHDGASVSKVASPETIPSS